MYLAKVVGTVVSTSKDERLVGFKLLLIQRVHSDGTAVGNQEVATMNSRPRQMRRTFFTRIRVLGGQIKFDQEPVRGMWRKRPRAGDVDVSASKVSLLEVPAMAISSATPGSGCGRTC